MQLNTIALALAGYDRVSWSDYFPDRIIKTLPPHTLSALLLQGTAHPHYII